MDGGGTRLRPLHSIRARLALLAGLSLVPLLALFGHAAYAMNRLREQSELTANLEVARAVAASFTGFVNDVSRTAVPLGEVIARGLPAEEAARLLESAQSQYAAIRELSWASPAGAIVHSSNPDAVGVQVADRDYFVRLLAGDDVSVSDLLRSRSTDREVIVVARAVREPGSRTLRGAVLALAEPARLGERSLTMRRTGGASFALLDRSGRIAFRAPALERPREERDALAGDPLVRRALAGEEAAGVFAADGRVGAAVPVALTGWVASASRADREAFGAVRIEFLRAGAVALGAALLALAAAARVGGRISASLRRLEAHADALGRGERVVHPTSTAPEIARLAAAYAGMAERLRASREAFATLFDSAPVGIVVLDGPSLRARWANRAYLAFLDEPHRSHGVEGKRLPEFVPGAEAGGLVRVLERVARGDIPHVESEYRHEGFLRGATFWRWSVRAVPSTERVGAQDLLLVMSEITEQVVARRRIEADRRRLRVLHDAGRLLADALEPAEAARRLARFVVPALADFCSIDAVSEDGALLPLALAHADPEREARALAAGGGGALGRESLAWRAISERRTLDAAADGRDPREALAGAPALLAALEDAGLRSLVAVPLVAGGDVVGALTLATAASGRVLDDEDVRLAEDLATGGAQALRNGRLFADVQRAVQNRDEVLWVVSHDLRTPLGAVTLGARAITGLPDEPDSLERARGTARRILSAGMRMGRLIGDLLDLARLRQGRIAVTRAAHAPAALLQDAADESRGAAHEKGLELRWSAEPDLPDVACDHGRILQVLGNLVSNAIQATERGEVRLSARRAGGEILFTVRDTGPGIPEADRTRIFERFRRGAGARYVGTGLGLAIAREIVEAHGGRLWVDAAPGPGATLHFTLPVARAGTPAGPRPGEPQAAGGEAQAGGGAAAPGAAAGRWPSTVP